VKCAMAGHFEPACGCGAGDQGRSDRSRTAFRQCERLRRARSTGPLQATDFRDREGPFYGFCYRKPALRNGQSLSRAFRCKWKIGNLRGQKGEAPLAFHSEPTWSRVRYSACLRRRTTMTPRSTAAKIAQTRRTVVASIDSFSFLDLTRSCGRKLRVCLSAAAMKNFTANHKLFRRGSRSWKICTITGPTVITNNDGMMKKKMGNTSLTPSFAAFSSACWRRSVRRCSE
jgi:hypothetical protein